MTTAAVPFTEMLGNAQALNSSSLCVGIDPDPKLFPNGWPTTPDGIYNFCARVVEATAHLVIAFKPQLAYFTANYAENELKRLIEHIREVAPGVPVILDAKYGDIGSTAEQYAATAFERYCADAVTLAPYMGLDSLAPYMKYEGKGAIPLCRTSNPGGDDLQNLQLFDERCGGAGDLLYERVARLGAGQWNVNGQLGLVVGATYPEELKRVRNIAPTLPLLIPGIGAQGGDEATVIRNAWRPNALVAVNSSRGILYPKGKVSTIDDCYDAALATRQKLEVAKQQVL